MAGKCVVVMGVSGSGKSSVAKIVAAKINAQFLEGDDFHSTKNIEKMKSDIPLNDDDRKDWLDKIHSVILQITNQNKDCVVSCSALKRKYRVVLRDGIKNILFVYLKGSYELIHDLMIKREHHFMSVDLLKTQFEDLEEPSVDEKDIVAIDILPDFEKELNNVFLKLKERNFVN